MEEGIKRVIIVGASSGIGLHVAELMVSRGMKVGVAARRTPVLECIKARNRDNVEYMAIDITKSDAAERLDDLIKLVGGMDLYVHVAGIGYDNPGSDPECEAEIVNTNSCGFARMVYAAYRYFRDNGARGHIAAVTSVAGTNGIAGMAAYSASKRMAQTYLVALEQLSRNEGCKIAFTDIRPGWIRTPLLHDGTKYPLEMTLDYAVKRIVRAIDRKKRVAVIDWRWRLLVWFWRLVPDCIWTRINAGIMTGR